MTPIHEQSLLRVPLVEWLLSRSKIAIETRPVDAGWGYSGTLSRCPVGFDPFGWRLYVASRSRFSSWWPHARGSACSFNRGEWLIDEVLSLVHDGIHLFALSELVADLWGGTSSPIEVTASNVDELAFIYVVTEAAATATLDYWYLARLNLDEVCPLGTRVTGLTSWYRELDIEEYRRFFPSFVVQHPSFLSWLVEGYCDHAFSGFSVDDLQTSPRLRRWLGHELKMSSKQLLLIRRWIRRRFGLDTRATLDFSSVRRRSAVRRLAARLYDLASGGVAPELGQARLAFPRLRESAAPDYRFTNLRALPSWPDFDASQLVELDSRQFSFFASQYLSAFEFEVEDRRDRDRVETAVSTRDFASLRAIARGRQPVAATCIGPDELIFTD